ncbi:glycosyltransferase family 4 protein, partial [Mediterraneibacter glycyrrhizinilyticus]|nr:glycosyltransferase family 4 protein [Mediterraneibacter glycyrrhizinilyticus]
TFVKSRDYKGNGMDRVINMMDLPFKTWKAMKLFYERQKPDVIYTSSPDLFVAFFALRFGRKYKIPVVVEVRDLWPESIVEYNRMSRKNPIIQVLYQLEKWIYKKADQLIFTMEGGKDYICDKGWEKEINLSKVNHVNNGVDLEEFDENQKIYQITDRDLEDDNYFKVLYMGSIRMVNNLRLLLKAAEELKRRKIPNIKILVYGDGTEKEALQQEAEKLDVNMYFKGRVKKKYIPYILTKADVNLINLQNSNLEKYG